MKNFSYGTTTLKNGLMGILQLRHDLLFDWGLNFIESV